MPPKKREFRRPYGTRSYRKMFVIAVEGVKTEPEYFGLLNSQQSVIHVNCLTGGRDSSPLHVLKRMEKHLRQNNLRPTDEAWLVVDKDQWIDEHLTQLYAWTQKCDNYNLALSNPKFEYWLLLHFEEGTGITSSRDCDDRLKRHLPNYDKGINLRKMTRDGIDAAIRRGRLRDTPPCTDWPRALGCTTVYKLVENILQG